ncbi:hypothetical protein VE23_19230 [Paenibacillus sp. D9]|nr:hypothetical protein VE23_19230 [Paenibacillus sp. D9]
MKRKRFFTWTSLSLWVTPVLLYGFYLSFYYRTIHFVQDPDFHPLAGNSLIYISWFGFGLTYNLISYYRTK